MTYVFDTASGFAASRTPPTEAAVNRLVLVGMCATTLAIVSQSWSKTSFAITLLRITDGKIKLFLWIAIIAMNVLFGLGSLFFWIPCMPLKKAWQPLTRGTCWDPWFNVVFGIVVSGTWLRSASGRRLGEPESKSWKLTRGAAFAGIMDIVFALIPWKILLPLRLNRKEKWGCVIAMSMGVLYVSCSCPYPWCPG